MGAAFHEGIKSGRRRLLTKFFAKAISKDPRVGVYDGVRYIAGFIILVYIGRQQTHVFLTTRAKTRSIRSPLYSGKIQINLELNGLKSVHL